MPGVTDVVERPASIRVRFEDLSGVSQTEEAAGLLVVILLGVEDVGAAPRRLNRLATAARTALALPILGRSFSGQLNRAQSD